MSEPIPEAVQSKAAIGGHPIHPMLVPLPIGFLVGALLSDIGYMLDPRRVWAQGSRWLLLGGVTTGLVAAAAGLVDFLGIPYVRSLAAARLHLFGNLTALALSLMNLLTRPADARSGVPGGGPFLSLVVVVLLGVTGWLGGELSYRYRVGVMPRAGEQVDDVR